MIQLAASSQGCDAKSINGIAGFASRASHLARVEKCHAGIFQQAVRAKSPSPLGRIRRSRSATCPQSEALELNPLAHWERLAEYWGNWLGLEALELTRISHCA